MVPSGVLRMVAVSCLMTTLGCAATGTANPLARTRQETPAQEKLASGTQEPSPFQPVGKNRAARPTARQDAAVRDAIRTVGHEESYADDSAGGTTHDLATQHYIDHELRDADPDERAELLNVLRGLDPQMVRKILKVRRMSEKMRAQNIADRKSDAGAFGTRNTLDTGYINPSSGREATRSGNQRMPDYPGDRYASTASAETEYSLSDTAYAGGRSDDQGTGVRVVHADRNVAATTYGHSALDAPNPSPGRPSLQQAGHREGLAQAVPSRQQTHRLSTPQLADASERYPVQRAGTSPTTGNVVAPTGAPRSVGSADFSTPQQLTNASTEAAAVPSRFGQPLRPTTTESPVNWQEELQKLIAMTESDVAESRPGTTEAEHHDYITQHVYLRMLYLMANQQERALQAIPVLEPADQEFWQQMFWAMANYFDSKGMPDSSDRATQTITQLKSAIQRLQEKARLELRNVAFCHKISSFGSYERFKRDEFSPGQPVLLYAEVDNFRSEPTADGQFRTILRSTIEIYKAGPDGDLVYREPFPATEDLCRNHRRDYFHSYEFTIPQRISLGPHVLKLTVEDQLNQKLTTYSLNFTVK